MVIKFKSVRVKYNFQMNGNPHFFHPKKYWTMNKTFQFVKKASLFVEHYPCLGLYQDTDQRHVFSFRRYCYPAQFPWVLALLSWWKSFFQINFLFELAENFEKYLFQKIKKNIYLKKFKKIFISKNLRKEHKLKLITSYTYFTFEK